MTLKRHWWSRESIAEREDPQLCKRRKHASHEAAMVALAVLKQQGFNVNNYAEKLHAKECKTCGYWHLVKK